MAAACDNPAVTAPRPTGFAALTLDGFGERLASAAPVPGGGSAAAVVGSLAAALVVMVARLSDRPRYAEHAETHARALAAAEAARGRFLALADEDAAAYAAYAAALKLPRDTGPEQAARKLAVAAAARGAAVVPLETVRLCGEVVALIEALCGRTNVNAASDLDVAAHLLGAAAAGAAANVRVNLPALDDERFSAALEQEAAALEATIVAAVAAVHDRVVSGEPRHAETREPARR